MDPDGYDDYMNSEEDYVLEKYWPSFIDEVLGDPSILEEEEPYNVWFQVLFDRGAKHHQLIIDAINEATSSYSGKQIEKIDELVERIRVDKKNDQGIIMVFSINFSRLGNNNDIRRNIVAEFLANLDDSAGCKKLWKFSDQDLLRKSRKIYQEIHKLEMEIREILNFIFMWINPPEKLLANYKLEGNIGSRKKKNRPKDESKKLYESDLFNASFEDYKEIGLSPLSEKENLLFLGDADTFKDWRQKIINRGVQTEHHLAFLNNLGEGLDYIVAIRNCVMHNRNFFDEDADSEYVKYQEAKKHLEESIKDFWRKEEISPSPIS